VGAASTDIPAARKQPRERGMCSALVTTRSCEKPRARAMRTDSTALSRVLALCSSRISRSRAMPQRSSSRGELGGLGARLLGPRREDREARPSAAQQVVRAHDALYRVRQNGLAAALAHGAAREAASTSTAS